MDRFLLAALLLATTGCSLFGSDPDTVMVISGRALADEQPIVGLSVTLNRSLRIGSVPVERTTTDASGGFTITHDPGETTQLRGLYINNESYDPRYIVYYKGFPRGTRVDLGDLDLTLPPAR